MINKKLDELGKYVEEIEKMELFDLCKTYINQVNEELKSNDNVKSELRQFVEKLIKQSKPIAEEICKEMEWNYKNCSFKARIKGLCINHYQQ